MYHRNRPPAKCRYQHRVWGQTLGGVLVGLGLMLLVWSIPCWAWLAIIGTLALLAGCLVIGWSRR
ncbi:MAG: hypothetical protein E7333_00020 [Clostridiales bacterium]|nr:hypothetical protein [Clostridiales bacterium]